MSITVWFACGHHGAVSDRLTKPPICACGEARISHVQAPKPTIRGSAEPIIVNLAPEGPLPVPLHKRDEDHG